MFISVYRTVILYIVVTVAIRLMGKRQIGDMQPGELVVTMLISEIAAMPLQDNDQPVIFGVAAVLTLVSLEILVSILSLKSVLMRKLVSGRSVVLIKDGIIDQRALKQVRLTALDLVELLRAQQVFDLTQVSFAVLETGGSLSVLLKAHAQPATAKDVGAKNPPAKLPLPVISDGKILSESLKSLGTTRKKLYCLLSDKGIRAGEVLLMTLDSSGNAEVVKKGERL